MKIIEYLVPTYNERDFGKKHNMYQNIDSYLLGLRDAVNNPEILKEACMVLRGSAGLIPVTISVNDPELEARIDASLREKFKAFSREDYHNMSEREYQEGNYARTTPNKKPFPKRWFARRSLMKQINAYPGMIYDYKDIPNYVDVEALKERAAQCFR
jgi:hypothetical protein